MRDALSHNGEDHRLDKTELQGREDERENEVLDAVSFLIVVTFLRSPGRSILVHGWVLVEMEQESVYSRICCPPPDSQISRSK